MATKTETESPSCPELSEDIFDDFDPKFRVYHNLEKLIFELTPETVDTTVKYITTNFTESSDISYVYDLIVYAASNLLKIGEEYIMLWSKLPAPDHRIKQCVFIDELVSRKIVSEDIYADCDPNDEYDFNCDIVEEEHIPQELKFLHNDDIDYFSKKIEIDSNLLNKSVGDYDQKYTYMDRAALFGAVKIFKWIIERGGKIDPNVENSVICGGNKEIFDMCVENGCTFSNAYESAIFKHKYDILKWIIKKNNSFGKMSMDICIKSFNTLAFLYYYKYATMDHSQIEKSLCYACKRGHFPLAKLLIENHKTIDYDYSDNNPNTPLAAAAEHGHLEIVKLLVENRASLEMQGKRGTPLYEAATNGQLIVLKFLLENGANIKTSNADERCPYDAFTEACCNNHFDVVEYMLDYAAHMTNVKICTSNCIKSVALHRNYKMLEFLINKGVDLGRIKGCGRQKLIRFIWKKYIKVNKMMPCVNIKQIKSVQVLLNEEKTKKIIELLLKNGCARHY